MKELLKKLDALETRVRALETRLAFGAGVIVATQILVGLLL